MVCTVEHKSQITLMVSQAVKVAKNAKKLLCYSHNVDIAMEAEKTQHELNCMRKIKFPCLELQSAQLSCHSKLLH